FRVGTEIRPVLVAPSELAEGIDRHYRDPETSGVHASIELAPGDRYVLKDLGSTNGTFLEGRRVAVAEIRSGQQFKCGANIYLFSVASSVGDTTAARSDPFGAAPGPEATREMALPDPPPVEEPVPPVIPPAIPAQSLVNQELQPPPTPTQQAPLGEVPELPELSDFGPPTRQVPIPSQLDPPSGPLTPPSDISSQPLSIPPVLPPTENPLGAPGEGLPVPPAVGPLSIPPVMPPVAPSDSIPAPAPPVVPPAGLQPPPMAPAPTVPGASLPPLGEQVVAPAAAPSAEAAALPPGVVRSSYGVYLVVERGRDAGVVFPVNRPTTVIGRADTEVSLNDPDISRRHAAFEVQGEGRYLLRDLKSTNGTQINGIRITEQAMADNDKIRLGSTVLKLVVGHGRVADALSNLPG
ncbi:MAG: FHA domain-containing protein, partial [Acidobacteriota bacterium]